MKNLRVWQKLTLMGLVLIVPFAVVTWRMASEIDALGIEDTQHELQGLRYYAPVATVIRNLQQHRALSIAVASGDGSFTGALAGKTAEVQTHLKRLEEIEHQIGASSPIHDKWRAFIATSRDLLDARNLSGNESFDRHTKVIADGIALIVDIGDSYHVSLDSSLDSYYLMNFVVLKGPELAEVVAQAGGIGTGIIASRNASPPQLVALNRLAVVSTFLQARLDKSLAKALAANEGLRPELEAEVRASSAAIKASAEHITRLSTGKIDGSVSEYSETLTRGVSSIFDLQDHVTRSLDAILTARVTQIERDVIETIAAAVVGLLIVSLIGLYIMRDVVVSLSRVVGVANQIAAGDLSVPRAPLRKDEIGVLAQAFDRMVGSLKETAVVAERIAAGDLAVTVTPKSDRDVLGNSLANMVHRLAALLGDVKQSGIQVNASVSDIAATARQQQATASEIAATTSQIGATSREISATSKELVKTMGEVSTVAEQSAALAGSGQAGLTRMEATMRHVMEAAGSINAKLAVLNEKAGDITHVVTTITKVADQTNLLSLNAAIEAEKAGEYGRGFAVVATEIRRLADQTAVATYDIDQMVKQIQSAVSAGVMGMDKFSEEVRRGMLEIQLVGDQLTQIIQQVQALAPRCEAVNEGMEAQASGAEQISQALGQLSEAAQQTVESLRQSGRAIDTLHEAATGMRTGVARFNLAA